MTMPIFIFKTKHFISNHTWDQVRELGRTYYNTVVQNTVNLVFVCAVLVYDVFYLIC